MKSRIHSKVEKSRTNARRLLPSLLVVFLVLFPLAPSFANCCCDGEQVLRSAVTLDDDRSAGHCHESTDDQHASIPLSCGAWSSSCPCPEIPPVLPVAENTGTKDTLTKLELSRERLSDEALEDGHYSRLADTLSPPLHTAREPLFLRLAVFRI